MPCTVLTFDPGPVLHSVTDDNLAASLFLLFLLMSSNPSDSPDSRGLRKRAEVRGWIRCNRLSGRSEARGGELRAEDLQML